MPNIPSHQYPTPGSKNSGPANASGAANPGHGFKEMDVPTKSGFDANNQPTPGYGSNPYNSTADPGE